jgi:acyl-coenzyme A synthetase/AMP-(fatty) acid ligase
VPDAARGENVAAFVVLRPGAEVDGEELRRFCAATLASYKLPRHVFAIEESALPRTATGKIEKAALRREALHRVARSPRPDPVGRP